ncbi:calcium-binding protein [Ruegeria atlantica]|uniref:calcium-binding protein n=1 Tax=Ruegeria atlantica TaxID=81569 RepID=UPI00147D832E|nr:calcium-binding protein [Ruegeria atlantica]
MFLIGVLSLAAVGGAAYAISDAFITEDDSKDDDNIEHQPDEISEGEFLEIDEDQSAPKDTTEPKEPSTGTILSDFEGDLVITGTDQNDVLTGQDRNDQINGYGADDAIDGGAGHDVLHGGKGADTIAGGEGNDTLHGEHGDDLLLGGKGDDALYGHFGADQMDGGEGADTLYGGQDDDILAGGAGDDALHGGFGDDVLNGGTGEDVLFGGDGDDILNGQDGDGEQAPDFLNGGAGEDTILADSGDIVTGGDDADDIIITPEPEDEPITVIDFQPGQDKLFIPWDGPEDPDIQIEQDADIENLTHVQINGHDVAQLLGAEEMTADDIQLITEAELARLSALG